MKIDLAGKRHRPGRADYVRAALLIATLTLPACSAEPRSLADYIAALCATTFRSASSDEAPYLAENVSAMTKMMIDMGIRPSGDVDKDFVAMMTPHHQGAIDMALAELRYGHNERLRRMAQEIIITQQQEIAAMRLAIDQPMPTSVALPTSPSAPHAPRSGLYHPTEPSREP